MTIFLGILLIALMGILILYRLIDKIEIILQDPTQLPRFMRYFLIALLLIPLTASATIEDFTTYTEVDQDSDVTVTATKVSWDTLTRDANSYVYKDMGVDFFSGDYEHWFELMMEAEVGADNSVFNWMIANDIGNGQALAVAGKSFMRIQVSSGASDRMALHEVDSGTTYADYFTITQDVLYHVKTVRDEAVGTYGTIYLYIYDDSARTNLLDTLIITLHTSLKDFQYIYGFSSQDTGDNTNNETGYTQNLSLDGTGPPTADTCTCPTDGTDWYVDSSDNCYLSTNCDLDDKGLYLLNTGDGAFNIIDDAELSLSKLESTSTDINVEAGCKINFK